jgi:hypothetical protein
LQRLKTEKEERLKRKMENELKGTTYQTVRGRGGLVMDVGRHSFSISSLSLVSLSLSLSLSPPFL